MSMDVSQKQERYTIQTIDKALDLLELLAEHGSLNLLELTDLLDQPKSSTYRIILTLEHRAFISRSDDNGKYCLGYKQLMLTRGLLERNTLRTSAMHEMKKLSERYGDTINLGVLVDGEVLYVDIIESTQPLRMTDTVGSRSPFHATAMGKAMTAYLPEDEVKELIARHGLPAMTKHTLISTESILAELIQVREQGFSMDDQEIVEGARCMAAPIFNMYGTVEGAVSLSGAMHRFAPDVVPEMAESIKAAAHQISLKLGYPYAPTVIIDK